jgi:hypothetical protein
LLSYPPVERERGHLPMVIPLAFAEARGGRGTQKAFGINNKIGLTHVSAFLISRYVMYLTLTPPKQLERFL